MLSGLDFQDRTVVVTGGTGALGSAVVEALLREGAKCVVPCILEQELERFRFADDPRVTVLYPVELTNEDQVAGLYRQLDDLWGSIHIAGGFAMSDLSDTRASDLEDQFDMNLKTCFLCCREAVKKMRGNGLGGGRLVNISARPALRSEQGAGMVPYAAAKAGVATLTQALSAELMAERVFVNAIAPSVLDTPANRAAMPNADHGEWVPLEAAADVIAYLASPANQAVTGAIMPVYAQS